MQRIIFFLILASIAVAIAGDERRSKCKRTKDIYNGDVYIKTLCTFLNGVDYHGGKTTCENNGMKLFVPEDANQVEQLKAQVEVEVVEAGYTRLWISGKRDGAKWKADTSERQQSLDDFYSTFSQGSGDCLSVVRYTKIGAVTIEGYGCDLWAWPYCEFEDWKPLYLAYEFIRIIIENNSYNFLNFFSIRRPLRVHAFTDFIPLTNLPIKPL
jgi:hypothetical protein